MQSVGTFTARLCGSAGGREDRQVNMQTELDLFTAPSPVTGGHAIFESVQLPLAHRFSCPGGQTK